MKRKNLRKILALSTAATMIISPMTAFAEGDDADTGAGTAATESADGATSAGSTINGSGDVEGYINKDVFKVVLPTVSDADFTVDPQGLLKIADGDKYGLGAGAIYFPNSDGSYSNTSDPIDIINKSSYDIDIAFSVNVTLPEGVTMVDAAADLANAKTPSVYLAMKEADDTDATALKDGDNKAATKKVAGVSEDLQDKADSTGYTITATGDGNGGYTYKYELGDKFDPTSAAKASYTLTGSCDQTADWSELTDESIETQIVWSATKHSDGPVLSASTVSASQNSVTVTSLGSATKVTGVSITPAGKTPVTLASPAKWSYNESTKTLTFVATVLSGNPGASITVTFDDDSTATLAVAAN